jgi:hypothetical protein
MSHIPGSGLLSELSLYSIFPDENTKRCIAIYEEVGKIRTPAREGGDVIEAVHNGAATADNILELVKRSASDVLATSAGMAGSPAMRIANLVENATTAALARWLEQNADAHEEILSAEVAKQIKVINEAAPKALGEAPTPDEILKAGRAALDARTKAQQANLELQQVLRVINNVRMNVGQPALQLGNLIDPASLNDDNLEAADDVFNTGDFVGLVRDHGLRLKQNAPKVADKIDQELADRRQAEQEARDRAHFEQFELRIATHRMSGMSGDIVTDLQYQQYLASHPGAQIEFYDSHPELVAPLHLREGYRRCVPIVVADE